MGIIVSPIIVVLLSAAVAGSIAIYHLRKKRNSKKIVLSAMLT